MPQPVMIGDRTITLDYSWKRHDLGFAVALKDFREITYPGITMAQSFESDVVVTSPERQFDRQISMNHPLKFQGYKIFQSSFQRGEKETSIFSVANDPGVPVVYTGFLILILGFILIFFVKPYLVRASGSRRDSSPEVPVQSPLGEGALEASASGLGGGNRHV
jgi:cytochrome c biogenesis protein ResB